MRSMLLFYCTYIDTTCSSCNAKRTTKLICLILAIFNAKGLPVSYSQIIFIFGLTLGSWIVRYGAAFSLILYFAFVTAHFGDTVSHKYAGEGYQATKGISWRRKPTKGISRRRYQLKKGADERYQPMKVIIRRRVSADERSRWSVSVDELLVLISFVWLTCRPNM
jgi:hypothetical protein